MILTYKKHCDDYHSPLITANVQSEDEAHDVVEAHERNGCDVSNVTLDGKTFGRRIHACRECGRDTTYVDFHGHASCDACDAKYGD